MLCETWFSCPSAEPPRPLPLQEENSPRQTSPQVPLQTRGAPSAPPGGSRPPPSPPGARALSLAGSPHLRPKHGAFPLTPHAARVCGAGRPSRLLLHLSLPPPIRVSGEWVTEGGGCHTTPPPPAETADSGESWPERPGARAGYSRWGRPGGAADLPQPGLALVRMLGGWAAGVGWGGGDPRGEGGRLSPLPGPGVSAGGPHSVRCARQVSALPGSRRPWWIRWVGLGCCELERVGRGARGARYPRVPAGVPRRLGLVGEARGKGARGWFRWRFRPGTGTHGNRRGAGARSAATWTLRPGAGATWRRRLAYLAETRYCTCARARTASRF